MNGCCVLTSHWVFGLQSGSEKSESHRGLAIASACLARMVARKKSQHAMLIKHLSQPYLQSSANRPGTVASVFWCVPQLAPATRWIAAGTHKTEY